MPFAILRNKAWLNVLQKEIFMRYLLPTLVRDKECFVPLLRCLLVYVCPTVFPLM